MNKSAHSNVTMTTLITDTYMCLCLLAQVETTESNVCFCVGRNIHRSYFKSCTHFLDGHHKAPCKSAAGLENTCKACLPKG